MKTDAPTGYYDILCGRLTFGITRSDGAIIGLGGRLIEKREDSPKYINSQESAIYHKRKSFFGVSQALAEMRRTGTVTLVEGYMDVRWCSADMSIRLPLVERRSRMNMSQF